MTDMKLNATSTAPREEKGWAPAAYRLVGLSLLAWAFVGAFLFAILRVAGWW